MSNKYWLEISLLTDGEAAEAVAEVLQPHAYAGSVIFEQLGAPEDPDPSVLSPEVTVKIFVPGEQDTPILRRAIEESCYHLNRLYPVPAPRFKKLADEDWATSWMKNYRPFRIGNRLMIQPSWLSPAESQEREIVITLDPGMAFGTGLHPSTQMCLQALEKLVMPGASVLDVGAGSGILSIAAAKLGASSVTAFDVDGVAARTTYLNAAANGVSRHLNVFHGDLSALKQKPWDIVVVNIIAPVIISLLERDDLLHYVAEHGRLIVSGIIQEQVASIEREIDLRKAVVEQLYNNGDWVAMSIRKNAMTPRGHDELIL